MTSVEILTYIAIGIPAIGFVINGLLLRWFLPVRYGGGSASKIAGYANVVLIGVSFVLSLIVLFDIVQNGAIETTPFNWVNLPGLQLQFGLILDPLTGLMLTLVSGVSLLVQIYSLRYMKGDKSYARFFAFMALFTASMLGLVSGRNLVQIFIFWELVGLCSYFLIAFWADRPSAVSAARKAFLMTRIGDFGFLLAMMYLAFLNPSWLDITNLYGVVHLGLIGSAAASWVVAGLLAGIVGKSAQLPLHAWLSDAMEGPTPVSTLLHSATMVTAGVFLIARLFPLFEHSNLGWLVAVIGLGTAIIGGTMGLASNDIKRVLAFSTISQIGYMIFALGIGAYGAAIFHLFIHAFFKAGLFMVAGNVGHIAHTFDMRVMGGLRRRIPLTYAVALICGLSLAAIFPLAGFWSKDEILTFGFENDWAVGSILLLVVSFLTALYTFRMIYLTFHGKNRGDTAGHTAKSNTKPTGLMYALFRGESAIVIMPMMILTLGAVLLGYLINPVGIALGAIEKHSFSTFITHNAPVFPTEAAVIAAGGEPHFSFIVATISVLSAVLGLVVGWFYLRGRIGRPMQWVPVKYATKLLSRQYFVNEFYEDWLIKRLFFDGMAKYLEKIEIYIVDTIGLRLGGAAQLVGSAVRRFQLGNLQVYALLMFLGVLATVAIYFVVRMMV